MKRQNGTVWTLTYANRNRNSCYGGKSLITTCPASNANYLSSLDHIAFQFHFYICLIRVESTYKLCIYIKLLLKDKIHFNNNEEIWRVKVWNRLKSSSLVYYYKEEISANKTVMYWIILTEKKIHHMDTITWTIQTGLCVFAGLYTIIKTEFFLLYDFRIPSSAF